MAVLADDSLLTVMRIVLHVAVNTGFGRIAKDMSLMTGVALGFGMQAQERESGQIVIEENVVLPRRFVMAVLANDPLLTVMWIVLRMAVVAT